MIKKLLPLIAIVALISACKKDDDTPVVVPPPVPEPVSYNIANTRDTSLEQTGSVSMEIFVQYVSGDKDEPVTIGVAGLPTEISATFSPSASGIVPYTSIVTFNAVKAKAGTYPIRITASTLKSGIRYFDMNLIVLPYSNAARGLEGKYAETGSCTKLGAVNNPDALVSVDPSKLNRIKIRGIWTGVSAYEVFADMNTSAKTLSVPPQTLGGGVTFQGSGSYTDTSMLLSYTINGALVNDTCSTTFTVK